jgi:16S rRNA (cytosine1402-N4)-methyltransferase
MGYERHIPAMAEEVADLLVTDPDGIYIDATLGTGGHTAYLMDHVPGSFRVIGLDQDRLAIEEARGFLERHSGRIEFLHGNFRNIKDLAGVESCTGIVADLGISSLQLSDDRRGFSYQGDGPLDMSMGEEARSVTELLATAGEREISLLIKEFGEERRHRAIAREIARIGRESPITTTGELRAAVERVAGQHGLMAVLSRVFQAFRIWANSEMDALEEFLPQAVELLEPGGRIVVISYHSLEDRIVKRFFKLEESGCVCPPDFPECRCAKKKRLRIMTRRPIRPSKEELQKNQRARSAKLRAAERI